MYALVGARSQILAAYSTTTGTRSRCSTAGLRQPNSARSSLTRRAGMRCYPLAPAARRRRLSPFVKGHACTAVSVHNKVMCVQSTPSQTHFVSVNLTTGTVTALPLSETGPVGWGMVAW